MNKICGRLTQISSGREVDAVMNLSGPAVNLRPRYNITLTQNAAAVRNDADRRQLSMLRWGLTPAWAKKPDIGNRLINARVISATEKPSFRAAFAKRRCIVPADGFSNGGARARSASPGTSPPGTESQWHSPGYGSTGGFPGAQIFGAPLPIAGRTTSSRPSRSSSPG